MLIIPAILTKDPLELDKLLRQIRDSKKFERVQVDFIDGLFADNETIHPSQSDLIPYLPLKFDSHLMVTEENILNWSKISEVMGYDRIIAQIESISHPEDFTCLAMDMHSPVAQIKPYLSKLELVLVMSVEPGHGGQKFVDDALKDVHELVELRAEKNYSYRICVDGGIGKEHLEILEKEGVDEVAVGASRVLQWV